MARMNAAWLTLGLVLCAAHVSGKVTTLPAKRGDIVAYNNNGFGEGGFIEIRSQTNGSRSRSIINSEAGRVVAVALARDRMFALQVTNPSSTDGSSVTSVSVYDTTPDTPAFIVSLELPLSSTNAEDDCRTPFNAALSNAFAARPVTTSSYRLAANLVCYQTPRNGCNSYDSARVAEWSYDVKTETISVSSEVNYQYASSGCANGGTPSGNNLRALAYFDDTLYALQRPITTPRPDPSNPIGAIVRLYKVAGRFAARVGVDTGSLQRAGKWQSVSSVDVAIAGPLSFVASMLSNYELSSDGSTIEGTDETTSAGFYFKKGQAATQITNERSFAGDQSSTPPQGTYERPFTTGVTSSGPNPVYFLLYRNMNDGNTTLSISRSTRGNASRVNVDDNVGTGVGYGANMAVVP